MFVPTRTLAKPRAPRVIVTRILGATVAMAVAFGGLLVTSAPAQAARPEGSGAELLVNSRDRTLAIQPGVVNPWVDTSSGSSAYRVFDAEGTTAADWGLPGESDAVAFAITAAGDEEPLVPSDTSEVQTVYPLGVGDSLYAEDGTWEGITSASANGVGRHFSGPANSGPYLVGENYLSFHQLYETGVLKANTVYSLVAFAHKPEVEPDYLRYVSRDASGHAVASWVNFTVSDAGFTLVSRVLPKIALSQSVTGTSGALTATLQNNGTGAVLTDATGTVSFFKGDDTATGTPVGAPVAVDATGKATVSLANLVPGSADGYYAVYTPDAAGAVKYTESAAAQTIVVVPKAEAAASALAVKVSTLSYGKAGVVKATVTSSVPVTGAVSLKVAGVSVGSADLVKGVASFTLSKALTAGKKSIVATFAGTETVKPATTTVSATVAKAASAATVKLSKSKAVVKKTKVKATVTVTVPGTTVRATGKVTIRVGSKTVKTVTLTAANKGKVTVTLPKFTKKGTQKVSVLYAGTTNVAAKASKSVSIKITKK